MGRGTLLVHGAPPLPFEYRYRPLPQPGLRLALLAREPVRSPLGRAELAETPFCYGTVRTAGVEHRALVVVDGSQAAFPGHHMVCVGLEDVAYIQAHTGRPACVLLLRPEPAAGDAPGAEVVYLRALKK
jgi:hypothetical protein